MSIDTIKNIKTNIVNNKTFFTSAPEVKAEEKKNGKILLMAGLVALSAVGIYIATRGKKGSGTSSITEEIQHPVEQIKDMAIDAFKQAGNKFEKGIAKLSNGENYTGKLTQQLGDGKVIVIEYKDGILQAAKKMNGEELISSKTYIYDNNANLTKIVNMRDADLFVKRTIGNYTRIKTKKGVLFLEDNTLKYHHDYKTRRLIAYDEQGKVSGCIHSYDVSPTRVGCYTYETPDGWFFDFDIIGNHSFGFSKCLKYYKLSKGGISYCLKKEQPLDINYKDTGEPFYDFTFRTDKKKRGAFIVESDGRITENDIPLDEVNNLLSDFGKRIKPLHKKALKIIYDFEEINNLFYPKA